MNASTLNRTAAQQGDQARQTSREACAQLRQQEADRLFEARLQWFLALSRAA